MPRTRVWKALLVVLAAVVILSHRRATAVQGTTTLTVTADNMALNGDTSSVDALINNPGADGISFREALTAVNNTGAGFTIEFQLPNCTELFFPGTLFLTAANTVIDGDGDSDQLPNVMFSSPDDIVWLFITSGQNELRHLAFKQLVVSGAGAQGNLIHKSFIGTDCDGFARHPRIGNGVTLQSGAHDNIIENNVVAGNTNFPAPDQFTNGRAGITIGSGAHNNRVRGNKVGLNRFNIVLANDIGVRLASGASLNLVGGERAGLTCEHPCNVISGNNWSGVQVFDEATHTNSIVGNHIGVSPAGTEAKGNGTYGVNIMWASGTLVGGLRLSIECDGPCNIISGNALNGVSILDPTAVDNLVQGNFIGVDATGAVALPNQAAGVRLGDGAHGNLIGGTRLSPSCDGPCNVISGNEGNGVFIRSSGTTDNHVQGNYLGLSNRGTAVVPNKLPAVAIGEEASDNLIGGDRGVSPDCAGPCNVISGNLENAVIIRGEGVDNNAILGNYIGVDAVGTVAMPNGDPQYDGVGNGVNYPAVWIGDGASHTVIGGARSTETCSGPCNLISGNRAAGLFVGSYPTATATIDTTILGNFIGVSWDGADNVPNLNSGVILGLGASENRVGGIRAVEGCSGPCNLISGNMAEGVVLAGLNNHDNEVLGNYIGVGLNGVSTLSNRWGVRLTNGAYDNQIGGWRSGSACDGPCNLIRGNSSIGVDVLGEPTQNNTIIGNYVVVNGEGVRIDAAFENVLGRPRAGSDCTQTCNLISGNLGNGVILAGPDNQVLGNYIGVDAAGTAAWPNGAAGVILGAGARDNIVGGARTGVGCEGPCNVISGNGVNGVHVLGVAGNRIQGNYIGLNAAGDATVPNGQTGVRVADSDDNLIGGDRAGPACDGLCNVISGNALRGVWIEGTSQGNQIAGNYIGVNPAGSAALPNQTGVALADGAAANLVGGARAGVACDGRCNVISGNSAAGVVLASATANHIAGNYIGLRPDGAAPLPNDGPGVHIQAVATGNLVGGVRPGAACRGPCNVIGGNSGDGLLLSGAGTAGNLVGGNYVGLDPLGQAALPNGGGGVVIQGGASGNQIGGGDSTVTVCNGFCNNIRYNAGGGVVARAPGSVDNRILRNAIADNTGLGIDLGDDGVTPNDAGDGDGGPNRLQNYPVLATAVAAGGVTVHGALHSTANTTYRLEFFSNDAPDPAGVGEGARFLGAHNVTTDAAGDVLFIVSVPGGNLFNHFVTATATDPAGNTSEFSAPVQAGNPPSSFTVNTVDDTDDGACTGLHCTLREAIHAANALPGVDLIAFDIAGGGPHVIQPTAALPDITDVVIIDGATEPDFAGAPVVVVDGAGAGIANGLHVLAGDSRIASLVIQNFAGHGVALVGAGRNALYGNYIGVAVNGVAPAGNAGAGVVVSGDDNFIGGETAGDGNVIAHNGNDGVAVVTGTGNRIRNNAIFDNGALGIDLGEDDAVTPNDDGDLDTGANQLQNFPLLHRAVSQSSHTTIAGELNGQPDSAYDLDFYANDSCDASGHGEGRTPLGGLAVTTDAGGRVFFFAHVPTAVAGVVVATATDMAGNTSEFSACVAVQIADYVVNAADDSAGACTVLDCSLREAINAANSAPGAQIIAFNLPGPGPYEIEVHDLPNITGPVIIDGSTQPGYEGAPIVKYFDFSDEFVPSLTVTGGGSTIRALALEFTGDALRLTGGAGNVIVGNILDSTYETALKITDSSDNQIGGLGPHDSNELRSDDATVVVLGDSAGNALRANSHTSGIDLNYDGDTPNDDDDDDDGPNGLQNYPVIAAVEYVTDTITLSGSLNSRPGTTFDLDFFASADCNYGREHEFADHYLGAAAVTTNPAGDATFSLTLPYDSGYGAFITATATDPDGNTSELAACVPEPVRPVFPENPLTMPADGSTVNNPPTLEWKEPGNCRDCAYTALLVCQAIHGESAAAIAQCAAGGGLQLLSPGAGDPTIASYRFETTERVLTIPFPLPPGTYVWTVTAVGQAGLVSPRVAPGNFVIASTREVFFPVFFKK